MRDGMNHLYSRVGQSDLFPIDTPERRAFSAHLALVAEALRLIERIENGDRDPGDDYEAILACLRPGAVLEALIEAAQVARRELTAELERSYGVGARAES